MADYFQPQVQWNLPLSGAVTMPITVNLGGSGNPPLEQEMLDRVGSYGRQIGWLCDALEALLHKSEGKTLTKADHAAIEVFKDMAAAIRLTKSSHKSGK